MLFARKVWRLLVAIKDGLALLFLLLFFGGLYAVLTMRPSAGVMRDGALLLRLDGKVVEEPARIDPIAAVVSGGMPETQYRARDLVRAIDAAATDGRVKALVFDLSKFSGGGLVHMEELTAAIDHVRAAGKPVLTYGTTYDDDSLMLAAHASEAWINPMGLAYVMGPGGETQYFGPFLERWKVSAHVFRVGTYKDFVEPYLRDSMSDPARAARKAVLDALFESWKANVAHARPKANLALVIGDPTAWYKAANGNGAQAALNAGLVDRIGDRVDFGKRVAALVGKDNVDDRPGAFAHTGLKTILAAHEPSTAGKKIGVVTIAGEIVDGDAGPGTAGGDRIADLIDSAAAQDIAGLVVRVDSPGGSVMASERIRTAIMRQKARGIPVAVSMANLAASGGYWVSTPGTRIFAEPATVTGSIGIFAIVPSFERTLADYGIKSDGVRTTPLSGQPDMLGGLTPEVEAMLQANIEGGYGHFIGLVAKSRGKTPQQIDAIAQGRIWDGGTARQIGLVDRFGSLSDALGWVAAQAKLKDGDWHAAYLGESRNPYASLLEKLGKDDDEAAPAESDVFARIAKAQRASVGHALTTLERVAGAQGAQAYCLGCPDQPADGAGVGAAPKGLIGWLVRLEALFG